MTMALGLLAGWSLAGIFMTLWLFGQRARAYSVDAEVGKARTEARRAVEFLQDIAGPSSRGMTNAVDSFLVPWACNDMATLRTVWPEWFAHRDRHLVPREKSA